MILSFENDPKNHLNFQSFLVEDIILIHAFGDSRYSTVPNPNLAELNLVRLVGQHFTSQLPSTTNKSGAQRKNCLVYNNG